MSTDLLVYLAPPNREHKAAMELRQKGAGTILPDDTTGKRRKLTAPRYVFADRAVDITFAEHAKPALPGTAPLDAVMGLFCRPLPKPNPEARRFAVGDPIRIHEGAFVGQTGVVKRERGRKWFDVRLDGGAQHVVAVQPRNMIHIDPG